MKIFPRHKRILLYTTLYLVLLTVLPFISGAFWHFPYAMQAALPLLFAAYLVMAWLLLAALGSCPLRWRSISPWVFVLCLAHAYWIEFLQGFWPGTGISSWYQLAAASLGAMAGIQLRLNYTYKRCTCSLSAKLDETGENTNYPPLTGHARVEALITHHPLLPQIIARSFGWKAMSINSPNGWKLEVICTGKSLVSLPHFSYGALFGDKTKVTPGLIRDYLENLHFNKGFRGLEYRRLALPEDKDTYKVSSWLPLKADVEAQMKAFPSNLRRKISKGLRNGFTVVVGKEELLDDFYKIYEQHMLYLGSGAVTRRLFRQLLREYNTHGGVAEIFLTYHHQKVVGAAFNLSYRGFYENGWFATQKETQKLYSSYVMHHAMIRHAIQDGNHTYSFGRSTMGSGVHQFKKQWGVEDVPLQWVQYPAHKVKLRKQSWLKPIWKLIPVPIRKVAGRQLAKWIY